MMPTVLPLWFLDQGIRVFPIKHRDKVPACASWDDYKATRAEAAAWTNYGVALGELGVVDSDSPEIEAWVAAHVPDTPFKVRTARGVHRYYRLLSATTHFIHRAGHTIEFRNTGQYVVGPGSVHPNGALYSVDSWSWDLKDVPFFQVNEFLWDDRPEGERGSADGQTLQLPPVIYAGERHDLLFKLMRSLQARGIEDIEQLLIVLRTENQAKCQPPIEEPELTTYIRRVARYKDRADFVRLEMVDARDMAGSLFEAGVSAEAALAAAQAVDATFNPAAPPQEESLADLQAEVARLELQIAKAKMQQAIGEPIAASPDGLAIVDEFDLESLSTIDVEEIE